MPSPSTSAVAVRTITPSPANGLGIATVVAVYPPAPSGTNTSTLPLGRPETVSGLGGTGATVRGYARLPVSPAASAVTVKVEVPAAVGVPVSAPEVLRLSPAGSTPVVTVKVNGPAAPDADSIWLYAAPIWPAGSDAGVMVTSGTATWTS